MNQKPEQILSILAEGGSLSISRVIVNGQERFLTGHHEHDFTDEGPGVNQQIGYGSLGEAFTYISEFPWHLLFLYSVHQDYQVQVLDLLVEKLEQEHMDGTFYRGRKLYEHEQALGARIYQDSAGKWTYSLDDFRPSKPEMFYK